MGNYNSVSQTGIAALQLSEVKSRNGALKKRKKKKKKLKQRGFIYIDILTINGLTGTQRARSFGPIAE